MPGGKPVINALTVDVEDYYHVSAFESVVGFANWASQQSRVEANTARVLDILAEGNVRATFFVLGWMAERYPVVVKAIQQAGHEIATHGYAHRLVYEQTPEEFENDLKKSLDIIQNITGERVWGFRAPSFSIVKRSLWALDILQECGLKYDSSIFPARPLVHNRYGFPGTPICPYEIRPGLWEFPMTTVHWWGMDFPIGGGGWLRYYPYALTRWGLKRINVKGQPAVVYLHPWELDPEQPRLKASPWRRFLHYHNLDKMADRLRALCRDFHFVPIREILDAQG